jgi:hypothetical protein
MFDSNGKSFEFEEFIGRCFRFGVICKDTDRAKHYKVLIILKVSAHHLQQYQIL